MGFCVDFPVEPGERFLLVLYDRRHHPSTKDILTNKHIESRRVKTSDGCISPNWLSTLLAVHFELIVHQHARVKSVYNLMYL